jgi:hypothetical protein
MNTLHEWSVAWRIPPAALADLRARLGALDTAAPPADPALPPRSEAAVQAAVRLAASRRGWRLWRNNVGAYTDPDSGSFVRYGLANDSSALNARVKSSDLVGIAPRVIAPGDVGTLIGQFCSFEVKREGWKYAGTDREVAQLAWITHVESMGGRAAFVSEPNSLL